MTKQIDLNKYQDFGQAVTSTESNMPSSMIDRILELDKETDVNLSLLMTAAIEHCKRQGVKSIEGITLPENTGMIELARKLGFKISRDFEEGSINMVLKL